MATAEALLRESELARNEASMLLAACWGVDRVALVAYPERVVPAAMESRFIELAERRKQGEPIAYLLGEREFYGLALEVTPAVLIPRPETEHLVDLALEVIDDRARDVLDLGTGSGAIAIAIAKSRPAARVCAVDASDAALMVAARNGARHGVSLEVIRSDWFAALTERRFDLIVSNPPYIPEGDAHLHQGDLRYEPTTALQSGPDGLDAIRHIVEHAPAYLVAGGVLALEHGYDQAQRVRALLAAAHFNSIESRRDLAGHERITLGRR